ncbi:MAG TPA: hypothetical protein VK464_03795, partial [Symbiobacteriaceae bacterium]|nr:hypothetical protein [Symbiobacteriaceae bacterium]
LQQRQVLLRVRQTQRLGRGLHALTGLTGSDVTVLGLPAVNTAALQELKAAGFSEAGRPVRMVRGEPLAWNPAALWGRFSGAMG